MFGIIKYLLVDLWKPCENGWQSLGKGWSGPDDGNYVSKEDFDKYVFEKGFGYAIGDNYSPIFSEEDFSYLVSGEILCLETPDHYSLLWE